MAAPHIEKPPRSGAASAETTKDLAGIVLAGSAGLRQGRGMKRSFILIVVALALAGCGIAREAEARKASEERVAAYNAVAAAAEADYGAKKITFGQMVARAADARMAVAPNDPLVLEEIYFAKLQGARVDKGEITIDEYRYSLSQKGSDIAARRQARAVQAVTAVAAINASRPQSVSCTSNRVGTFTYTNCD